MATFNFPSVSGPNAQRPSSAFPAAQQLKARERQVLHYVASGDFLVPNGVTDALVIMIGGGGGGKGSSDADAGGGGSAGETLTATVRFTAGQRYTVTVGAAGAINGPGGDSSLVGQGVYLRARGGLGSTTTAGGASVGATAESPVLETRRLASAAGGNGATSGGNGTAGGLGDAIVPGGVAGTGSGTPTSGGGGGGSSPFGQGGAGGSGAENGSAPALPNTGAGGGGAGGIAGGGRTGGVGSAGFVRIIFDV
jgi:hypothetical protein